MSRGSQSRADEGADQPRALRLVVSAPLSSSACVGGLAQWSNGDFFFFFNSPNLIVTMGTSIVHVFHPKTEVGLPDVPGLASALAPCCKGTPAPRQPPSLLSLTSGSCPSLSSSCFAVAASTPNSTAGAAMNSLTSLGTLQGLAGATVGLNNINALAGSAHSEYLLLWWTAFPPTLHRRGGHRPPEDRSRAELRLGVEWHRL